mgnify:CR=1 FL=1
MKILFFSGAGLSADSGLSTFRDANGLWDRYNIDEVCNFITWRQNYELVHEFYNARRLQYKDAKPNKMHEMIADIQKMYPESTTIITQNVDTLLEKAGCKDVMHVHGRIDYIHCVHCFEKIYIEEETNYYVIDVKLFNDMTNLGHVYILKNTGKEEITKLENQRKKDE